MCAGRRFGPNAVPMNALSALLTAVVAACAFPAPAEAAGPDDWLPAVVLPYVRAACVSQDPYARVAVHRVSEGLRCHSGAYERLFTSRIGRPDAVLYERIAARTLSQIMDLAMSPEGLVEYVESRRHFYTTHFFAREMDSEPFLFRTMWRFMRAPYNELEFTPRLMRRDFVGRPSVMLEVAKNAWLTHWADTMREDDIVEDGLVHTIFRPLAQFNNVDFHVYHSRELLKRLVLGRRAPLLARHCARHVHPELAEASVRAQIAEWWHSRWNRPESSFHARSRRYTLYLFVSHADQMTLNADDEELYYGVCVTIVDMKPSKRGPGDPLIIFEAGGDEAMDV